jgi:hypothetical protein
MTSRSSPSIVAMSEELQACRKRLDSLAPASRTARGLARLIGRIGDRLARPPRIVLLGEFNSGKSTLANALIGADVLPTSIHANTRLPVHVRYSAEPSLAVELADRTRNRLSEETFHLLRDGRARMLHVGLPVERLTAFELIDTPGLASGMMTFDCANLEACARANIAIWCTASTQAWKATERAAWHALPERLRRRGLLVATLADTLNSDRDRSRVEARLRGEACPAFAGLAIVAAATIDELRRSPPAHDFDARWVACGGEALDAGVQKIIDQVMAERISATGRVLARTAARHDGIAVGSSKAA